jgi:hypothetical protein
MSLGRRELFAVVDRNLFALPSVIPSHAPRGRSHPVDAQFLRYRSRHREELRNSPLVPKDRGGGRRLRPPA